MGGGILLVLGTMFVHRKLPRAGDTGARQGFPHLNGELLRGHPQVGFIIILLFTSTCLFLTYFSEVTELIVTSCGHSL